MRNGISLIAMVSFGIYLFSCSQHDAGYNEEITLDSDYAYTEEYYDDEYDESVYENMEQTIDQQSEQKEDAYNSKDHSAVISSEGLTQNYKDKQFIKTADLHFKVSDVYTSTVNIEDILLNNDGFVINSNLYADIYTSTSFPISKDSIMLVEEYQTRNNITVRIPHENMHSFLLAVADEIVFLNSRVLDADDVGLRLLAEELSQKRNAQSAGQIQNNVNQGGKLDDKIYAQNIAFERQTEKDISYLKQLSIEDQVEYATITIAIYQEPELHYEKQMDINYVKEQFAKSYGRELGEAFLNGFDGIKTVFRAAVSIWPIFILFGLGIIAFRRFF